MQVFQITLDLGNKYRNSVVISFDSLVRNCILPIFILKFVSEQPKGNLKLKKIITTFALLLLCINSLNAQFGQQEVLSVEAFLSVDKIRPGDEFKIGVKARIEHKWHINSRKPADEFLIPTKVEFAQIDGFEFGEVYYPEGQMLKFEFSETPLSVYEGDVLFWTKAKVSEGIIPGELKISGDFSYQACNDVMCLIPTSKSFEIVASIVGAGTPVKQINESEFEIKLSQLAGERSTNEISNLISERGLVLTLSFIFLGGLLLNLTPCVYPIIPITISFFVGQASGKISKSFFLALIYVLGMSITYSVLGVVAAMTGGLLGSSLQNPLVLVAIAGVFLLFAASMFGAFEIRVPAFLSNMAGGSRQGVIGSLFMGLTVGIVAAPCIGPFVLSLLTYVAAKGDPFTGFLLFFVLSLGLGFPYIFLGTFSSSIKNLPRSGEWMVWVKKVFGVVMIAMAVYFIDPLISNFIYAVIFTATVVLGGILVGFFDKSTASFGWFKGLKPAIGTLMILLGVWTSVSAWTDANTEHVNWQPYDEQLVAQAINEDKPILIDFYADWCIPCKQIEKKLFTQPAIIEKSGKFLALKADLTKEKSLGVKDLRTKYEVHGVPTIILIDGSGNEHRRFTDELLNFSTEEFLEIMAGALNRNE